MALPPPAANNGKMGVADDAAIGPGRHSPAGLALAEPLLDARQVARLLNVRESWVRDAARSGTLPCVRVGRHVRFTRPMLENWLAQRSG